MTGAEVHAGGVHEPRHRVAGWPVVRQRLAHPHEDHVRHALRSPLGKPSGRSRRPHHLRGDLPGREVVRQAHLPRGAERASHRTARLGGDTDRHSPPVSHDHGLDHVPAAQPEQALPGGASIRFTFGQDLQLLG